MVDALKSEESIRGIGFKGFHTVSLLREKKDLIPDSQGIYIVMRRLKDSPVFLDISTGGHFKGKDPTVSIDRLSENWVSEATVLYIGKAGSPRGKSTLQSRLAQYLAFGTGSRAAHWGGRFIWQIQDAQDLIICWLLTPEKVPRDIERKFLAMFRDAHIGRRPFANLQN